MLGYDNDGRRFINKQLSEELTQISEIKGLVCTNCYCIGNSANDVLKVCVDEGRCLNNRVPLEGKSVVCCKFILPDIISNHQLVREKLDNPLESQYVKCYLVIDEKQLTHFFTEVYQNFLL